MVMGRMVSRSRPSTRSPLSSTCLRMTRYSISSSSLAISRAFSGNSASSCATAFSLTVLTAPTRLALSPALIAWDIAASAAASIFALSAGSISALIHEILVGGPALSDQLLLDPDELADALLRHLERLEHLGLGDLQRAALDHDDRVGGAAHDEVDRGDLEVLEGGIEDPVVLDPAHAHRGERPVPRHRGEAERGAGGDDAEDVGIVLLVGGEDGDEDLDLVLEALGEQRADRAVDQAAGQDFLVRRPAFALEKSARNLAGRVGLLAILDGQGEEREGGDVGGYGDGRQDHRVAEPERCGAGGLPRQPSGFDDQGTAGELGFDPLRGHCLLSLSLFSSGCVPGWGHGSRVTASGTEPATRDPRSSQYSEGVLIGDQDAPCGA